MVKILMQRDHVENAAMSLNGLQNSGKIRMQFDIILQYGSHQLAAIDQRLQRPAMAQPTADFAIG